MISLKQIETFLNTLLQPDKIKDYGPNGLQVTGNDRIEKIALGVSANLEFFKKAVEQGCQACLVHHGLFWKNDWPITIDPIWKGRLEFLFKHNLSLFAYHLPLDVHPEMGNNAQILKLLNCSIDQPFGYDEGTPIGFAGTLPQPTDFDDLVKKTTELTGLEGVVFPFGKKKVSTIATVVGGGSYAVKEAIAKGYDVFLTGNLNEHNQEVIREGGINVIAPGHYVSEQFGVKAVGEMIREKLGVGVEFLKVSNIL